MVYNAVAWRATSVPNIIHVMGWLIRPSFSPALVTCLKETPKKLHSVQMVAQISNPSKGSPLTLKPCSEVKGLGKALYNGRNACLYIHETGKNFGVQRDDVILTRWPSHLTWLLSTDQWLYSELLPDGWTSHLIVRGPGAQPPYKGSSFWPTVHAIQFFWSLPKAHDHSWGWEQSSTGTVRASHIDSTLLIAQCR